MYHSVSKGIRQFHPLKHIEASISVVVSWLLAVSPKRPRTLVYTDLVEVLGERPHPIKSEISKFVTAGVVQIFSVMTLGERA